MMDCEQAIERLPWLLNGTLPPEERRAVEIHVAECGRCAQALAETRAAWKVFAQHLPAADLVAYAADEPTGVGKETLERHLAGCPQCAAELEMARASRALAEHEEVAVLHGASPAQAAAGGRRRGPRLWQGSALAASLVGLVAIGGWAMAAQRAHGLSLELREARRAAEAAPAGALTAPAAGGPGAGTVTLAPLQEAEALGALRGGAGEASVPTLTAGQPCVLILDVDSGRAAAYRSYAIVDSHGAVRRTDRWVAGQGTYGLVFDSAALGKLSPGRYAVQLYGEEGARGTPLASFPFTVAAPSGR